MMVLAAPSVKCAGAGDGEADGGGDGRDEERIIHINNNSYAKIKEYYIRILYPFFF